MGSQKLQSLQTSSSLYCAYRSLRTGLRGTWCRLLFARRLQVLQPLRLNTPPPSSPARSIGELTCSLCKIRRQYLRQKHVTPLFYKDKTTLLPSLRFWRTNTSPCLVLVQEKCNVCYHYNRVTQYFLTGNRGRGDSFWSKKYMRSIFTELEVNVTLLIQATNQWLLQMDWLLK